MSGKFTVSLSFGKDNTDKATVAFVVANAALASGKEVVVFLSIEAVHLSQQGYADAIHEEGFAPLKELMENYAKEGGKMYVCSPCFKKRKLDENQGRGDFFKSLGTLFAGFVANRVEDAVTGLGPKLLRPPGALDEFEFLTKCTRCDRCMRACPENGVTRR